MPPKKRKIFIKENTATMTNPEMARACGVVTRTIDRDIAEMKKSGEYDDWIEYEFRKLHRNPEVVIWKKYESIVGLLKRRMAERREVIVEAELEVKLPELEQLLGGALEAAIENILEEEAARLRSEDLSPDPGSDEVLRPGADPEAPSS